MLAEFQKMLPPEQLVAGEDRGAFPPPGSGSQAKTSTEQIEATFESLLKEPLGSVPG